jgi:hypothetical protein
MPDGGDIEFMSPMPMTMKEVPTIPGNNPMEKGPLAGQMGRNLRAYGGGGGGSEKPPEKPEYEPEKVRPEGFSGEKSLREHLKEQAQKEKMKDQPPEEPVKPNLPEGGEEEEVIDAEFKDLGPVPESKQKWGQNPGSWRQERGGPGVAEPKGVPLGEEPQIQTPAAGEVPAAREQPKPGAKGETEKGFVGKVVDQVERTAAGMAAGAVVGKAVDMFEDARERAKYGDVTPERVRGMPFKDVKEFITRETNYNKKPLAPEVMNALYERRKDLLEDAKKLGLLDQLPITIAQRLRKDANWGNYDRVLGELAAYAEEQAHGMSGYKDELDGLVAEAVNGTISLSRLQGWEKMTSQQQEKYHVDEDKIKRLRDSINKNVFWDPNLNLAAFIEETPGAVPDTQPAKPQTQGQQGPDSGLDDEDIEDMKKQTKDIKIRRLINASVNGQLGLDEKDIDFVQNASQKAVRDRIKSEMNESETSVDPDKTTRRVNWLLTAVSMVRGVEENQDKRANIMNTFHESLQYEWIKFQKMNNAYLMFAKAAKDGFGEGAESLKSTFIKQFSEAQGPEMLSALWRDAFPTIYVLEGNEGGILRRYLNSPDKYADMQVLQELADKVTRFTQSRDRNAQEVSAADVRQHMKIWALLGRRAFFDAYMPRKDNPDQSIARKVMRRHDSADRNLAQLMRANVTAETFNWGNNPRLWAAANVEYLDFFSFKLTKGQLEYYGLERDGLMKVNSLHVADGEAYKRLSELDFGRLMSTDQDDVTTDSNGVRMVGDWMGAGNGAAKVFEGIRAWTQEPTVENFKKIPKATYFFLSGFAKMKDPDNLYYNGEKLPDDFKKLGTRVNLMLLMLAKTTIEMRRKGITVQTMEKNPTVLRTMAEQMLLGTFEGPDARAIEKWMVNEIAGSPARSHLEQAGQVGKSAVQAFFGVLFK